MGCKINKLFFLVSFGVIFCSCSSNSSSLRNRSATQASPRLYPNYQTNSGPVNSSGSYYYVNPYDFQSGSNQIYDYDQYYVAPTRYKNIEPEYKNVILNKY